MTDLSGIISDLENRKAAIDKALAALRDMTGTEAPKRRGRPPAKRAEATAPTSPLAKRGRPAKKQSRISEEGRERLRRSMKKRWAAKRAAGAKKVVKRPAKKAAKKTEGQLP